MCLKIDWSKKTPRNTSAQYESRLLRRVMGSRPRVFYLEKELRWISNTRVSYIKEKNNEKKKNE